MILAPDFIRRHLVNRGLSELSVVFGLVAAASFLLVLVAGAVFHATYGPANVNAFRAGIGGWLVFMGWFWIVLVNIGRQVPGKCHSTGELTMLQLTCALVVGVEFLFASPKDRPMVRELGLVFEVVVIGFHCVYFTLAAGIGVKVPFRSYLAFAAMVGLVALAAR